MVGSFIGTEGILAIDVGERGNDDRVSWGCYVHYSHYKRNKSNRDAQGIMKKRKREGKAHKRHRRNRQRHAFRIGRWPSPTTPGENDPIGRDPLEGLYDEMVPFIGALAMRKYITKQKKDPGESNAKS